MLVGKMPTTCAVVGCHNRHSKQCGLKFYRFPMNKDRCRLWIAVVSRRSPDGSPWQPGSGDRVCSDHFISKKKSDIPSSPDYVPSVQTKELELPECSARSEDSYRRFERARCRARMQEQHSKELEKNRRAVEFEQAQLKDIQRAITHDHTYASSLPSSEGDLVSLKEPPSEELVMHEKQDQASLPLLVLSDERGNENKELGEEPLGQSEDASIPVEVGKTILLTKCKLHTICLF